jgi:hypothetical protein
LLGLVAPLIGPAVLEPEDCRRGVRHDVFHERRVDWRISTSRHENLDRILRVANGSLIQAALDTLVRRFLPAF